jgi:hypothetical protein
VPDCQFLYTATHLGDLWLGRILAGEKAKYDKELAQLREGYEEKLER